MEQISAWVSRWDRLTVTLYPGAEHPGARLHLKPGLRVAAQAALLAIVLAFVVAISVASVRWPWLAPFAVIFFFGRSSTQPQDVVIRDPMLIAAAADIAQARGRQLSANRWRIAGTEAGEMAVTLRRLDVLATTLGDRSRAEQEQMLIDLAGPQVRPFLRRSTGNVAGRNALEPPTVEPGFHQPGDPWPTLSTPPPEWPQYERRD